MRAYNYAMRRSPFGPLIVFFALASAGPARGNIIYSGLQNVVLQNQNTTLDLAGSPGTWDNLQLSIEGAAGGSNDIHAGAEVALASSSSSFPLVTRLGLGDPYPSSPLFGSGSEILWGFGTGPADGEFFAATKFATFGTGPAYLGWIHFNVQNSATSNASLTVIDWAYSDVAGQTLAMGAVPEPSYSLLIGLMLLLVILFRTARRNHRVHSYFQSAVKMLNS